MINRAHDVGVGEIYVTNIEHEGVMKGYSLPLLNEVLNLTNLPVVINGGAGCHYDFRKFYEMVLARRLLLVYFFGKVTQTMKSKNHLGSKGYPLPTEQSVKI